MPNLKIMSRSLLLALYGSTALAALPTAALAQNTLATPAAGNADVVPSVSVVGSRRVGVASATDTPVAVDFIPMTKAADEASRRCTPAVK